MKSAVASILVLVVASDSAFDGESNSLLQNKKEQKERSDLVTPLLNHATKELARVGDQMSDTEMQHVVDKFSSKLSAIATSVLQMPQTEQAALLRRASQGKELRGFAESYVSLPDDVKMKVRDIALLSPAVNDAYDVLPKHEQETLLVQLDKSTSAKRCERKRASLTGRSSGLGDNIRVCETFTRNGRGGHRHTHWSSSKGSATETVTENKKGDLVHRHFTKHTHNGQGGDASTETATQGKNGYGHAHSTAHRVIDGRTITATATSSSSHGGGHQHTHGHVHSHKIFGTTSTNTGTQTVSDGEVVHSHDHSHDFHGPLSHTFDEETVKTIQNSVNADVDR